MRVELQCFLYIHLYFFLCFDAYKLSFTMWKCTLIWALCKLKARGSLEYSVRHPRKHLRVLLQRINTNVQPKAFLKEPTQIPWHLHFEESPNPSSSAVAILHLWKYNRPLQVFHSSINLLIFPTLGKNFRGNIELQWPRRQDCLGSRISLVARPEIS